MGDEVRGGVTDGIATGTRDRPATRDALDAAGLERRVSGGPA